MTTMNISLPEELRAIVEEQIASGRYSDHSEYVRSLIRQDQRRINQSRLESELLARLKGESVIMDDADWKEIRAEFGRQLKSDTAKRKRSVQRGVK